MIQAKIVAEPVNEPLSIEECYLHLRTDIVDSDGRPDDALIMSYAKAARVHCENFTGLSLALKTYEVRASSFPDPFELPHPPFVALVNGISISDDISTNAIDEDSYTVDDYTDQFAVLTPTTSWPTLSTGNSVRVRYLAGYGDESEAYGELPQPIRIAMLLMLGHLYRNREASEATILTTIPLGVESFLRPYRVLLGMA